VSDEAATDETDADEVEPAEALDPGPEVGPFGCQESMARGERVIYPAREQWQEIAQALLDDGWNMCIDLTAIDYLTYNASRNLPDGVEPERFEVMAAFINHTTGERLRARAQVPADDTTIGTLTSIYPGSDYLEREVYDMFGITFEDHPDLSHILMPENWEGHPLRKDYAVGAIPVQFKGPQGG
jgi:NADH-quinone oxidoreductase subunit C